MQVYDPTRRTVMELADVEAFGEAVGADGWRAARYRLEAEHGDWFAYRLTDNQSVLLQDADPDVRPLLESVIHRYTIEETILTACELLSMEEPSVLSEVDRQAWQADVTHSPDLRLLENVMRGARAAGYSEDVVLSATRYLGESMESLQEAVLKGVETITVSEIEDEA